MRRDRTKFPYDEYLYRVVVTEYFMIKNKVIHIDTNNGTEKLTETRLELVSPSRATAGALFNYAIDFCKHHNVQSDNTFRVNMYNHRGELLKSVVTKGTLTENEYNAILHDDYITFSRAEYTHSLNKPVVQPITKYEPHKRQYNELSINERKQIAKEAEEMLDYEVMRMHDIGKATLEEVLANYGENIIWR